MRVVVVGSNPSGRSPDQTPFHPSTRSGKIVREWLSAVPGCEFVNVSDEPTPENRALKTSEIKANLDSLEQKLAGADGVVTVGRIAERAVELLDERVKCDVFLELPHPSGRCRWWNNPEAHNQRCEAIFSFIEELRKP